MAFSTVTPSVEACTLAAALNQNLDIATGGHWCAIRAPRGECCVVYVRRATFTPLRVTMRGIKHFRDLCIERTFGPGLREYPGGEYTSVDAVADKVRTSLRRNPMRFSDGAGFNGTRFSLDGVFVEAESAPEAPPLYATEAEALAAPGEVYRHYKGGIYRVLHSNVRHTEDLSAGVVYEHLWPHAHGVWYRPAALFFGSLEDGTPRFVRVKAP